MADPSAPDIQEQVRQAQQSAWAQAASQQQQAQSFMAPPSPSASPPSPPFGMMKSSAITIHVGKLSLLSISLSLMLLGAFTFLGGFLFGMWAGGPKAPQSMTNVGETPTYGLLTPQQMPLPQPGGSPIQGGGIGQSFKQVGQDIGFGHIASTQSGIAAQSAVTGISVPGVPSFLSPLVTATQYAVGQQLGYKAQQQVGQRVNQTLAAPQQQAPAPVQTYSVPQQQAPAPAQSFSTPQPQAPSPQSAQPSSQSGGDGYTIRLGAYAARENAQALVNQLQALNYTSHIVPGKGTDGNTLYYVNSGLYNDYKTATDAASQFKAQNIPGALVVKITSDNKGGL